MTQGYEIPLLSSWQTFYMIVGTAAATLTGLMFVATTLVAGLNTHESIANAGIATFNTPTVVHFCTVLLLAGMFSAPWQTFSGVSILLGLFGFGMLFYQLIILRRMWQMPHYQSTLEDWLWYMVLPLLAHVSLIAAALMLPKYPAPALYIVGMGMIVLLLVGIRNSWDNVTFLAVKRSNPNHTHNDEKKSSRVRNQENRKG
jgi:amino acid transporter